MRGDDSKEPTAANPPRWASPLLCSQLRFGRAGQRQTCQPFSSTRRALRHSGGRQGISNRARAVGTAAGGGRAPIGLGDDVLADLARLLDAQAQHALQVARGAVQRRAEAALPSQRLLHVHPARRGAPHPRPPAPPLLRSVANGRCAPSSSAQKRAPCRLWHWRTDALQDVGLQSNSHECNSPSRMNGETAQALAWRRTSPTIRGLSAHSCGMPRGPCGSKHRRRPWRSRPRRKPCCSRPWRAPVELAQIAALAVRVQAPAEHRHGPQPGRHLRLARQRRQPAAVRQHLPDRLPAPPWLAQTPAARAAVEGACCACPPLVTVAPHAHTGTPTSSMSGSSRLHSGMHAAIRGCPARF
jgi:hypothetical protein